MFEKSPVDAARHSVALLTVLLASCGGAPPAESPSTALVDRAGAEPMGESDPAEPPREARADGSASDESAGAGATPNSGGDFKRLNTHTAKDTQGVAPSRLKPTATEAHLKFVVVDKGKGEPIEGIVISLTGPTGEKYYTKATDATGFADLLVPAGQKYEVVYVSLRGKDIGAKLQVEDKKRFTLKLTLRYNGWVAPPPGEKPAPLVLDGVHFDTGKATIRSESFPRLDNIVEYMTHNSGSRIVISGHTDNVGNKQDNKALSTKRAQACRAYLITQGVDGSRISAVGYGDERPISTNDTAAGRQKNRRIEAMEL